MDRHFLHHGQEFVWDSAKASSNFVKHGVRFEDACDVFFDRLLHLEEASTDDEERCAAIGMTRDWQLLLVVHIEYQDESIRIISARPATVQERKRYED